MIQVRNFGFNLLESISKAGSALAPLIVDLGGQVGWSDHYDGNKYFDGADDDDGNFYGVGDDQLAPAPQAVFLDHSLEQDKIIQVAVLAVFGGVVLTAALPVLGLPETRGKALPQTVNQVSGEIFYEECLATKTGDMLPWRSWRLIRKTGWEAAWPDPASGGRGRE